MFRYHGGEIVPGGFYFNRKTWGIAVVNREGVLAGEANELYARIPALAALVVAPIAGAAFAMFLPFIGIAMVLDLGARKIYRSVSRRIAAATSRSTRSSRRQIDHM